MISKLRRLAGPFVFVASLALVVAMCLPPATHAQSINTALINLANADPVAGSVAADDTDVAFLVKYIGNPAAPTLNSGLMAVTVTSSDLTFTQGVLSSEAASTEFECPVSGALGGIIDVSNAACNTLGEIADVVNASTSWRMVILDGLRSDIWDGRGLTLSATRATSEAGLAANWDTSTAFMMSRALTPYRSFADYLVPGTRGTLRLDRYSGTRTGVFTVNAVSTYGSGTSTWQFFSVKPTNPRAGGGSSETATLLYEAPAGASTVSNTLTFGDFGVQSKRNEKLLIRLNNSAAAASAVLRGYGLVQRYQ